MCWQGRLCHNPNVSSAMSRDLLAFILFLSFSCAAFAKEIPADPRAAGIQPESVAKARNHVQKLVDDGDVGGAVVVVSRNGKLAMFEAFGKRNLESGEAMTTDSIFRIYSMTKPVTSVAIMMLVEAGELELDAPVDKYLPELAGLKLLNGEEPGRSMTIRDLLRHSAGLTYGFMWDQAAELYRKSKIGNSSVTLDKMVKDLGRLPLLHEPGTTFSYSVATDVLGRVVEVVSEQTLDQFFLEKIFNPLSMNDTAFSVPPEKLNRFTTNHGAGEENQLKVIDAPETSKYREGESVFLSGGGGLVSTAADYLRFCQMLLNNGELDGVRLLKDSTVKSMVTNQLPASALPIGIGDVRDGVGFGLGFSVRMEKSEKERAGRVGEYGWGGAASTHFWISPKDNLIVITLRQHMPYQWTLETDLKPIFYDGLIE